MVCARELCDKGGWVGGRVGLVGSDDAEVEVGRWRLRGVHVDWGVLLGGLVPFCIDEQSMRKDLH